MTRVLICLTLFFKDLQMEKLNAAKKKKNCEEEASSPSGKNFELQQLQSEKRSSLQKISDLKQQEKFMNSWNRNLMHSGMAENIHEWPSPILSPPAHRYLNTIFTTVVPRIATCTLCLYVSLVAPHASPICRAGIPFLSSLLLSAQKYHGWESTKPPNSVIMIRVNGCPPSL